MPKILAVDTTTAACSVAINLAGKICEDFRVLPRQHNVHLLPMINELLTSTACELKSLDALAYTSGPGSFTGLRLVSSVVQGLAFAADLPVISVPSLQALALQAQKKFSAHHCICILHSHANLAYIAYYELSSMHPPKLDGVIKILPLENIQIPNDWKNYAVVGNVPDKLLDKLTISSDKQDLAAYPHAQAILNLATIKFKKGDLLTPELAIPTYVNNQVTS